LHIEDFQAGEPTFTVVISGDPLGQMFSCNGSLAKGDAQRVYFRVVTTASTTSVALRTAKRLQVASRFLNDLPPLAQMFFCGDHVAG
jgi:hypothetical protein